MAMFDVFKERKYDNLLCKSYRSEINASHSPRRAINSYWEPIKNGQNDASTINFTENVTSRGALLFFPESAIKNASNKVYMTIES